MTVSVNTSGSQTATIGTEHDLATVTSANVLELDVDVDALVGGATPDIVEFRAYGKARTGDTERLIKVYTLVGDQSENLFKAPPVVSPHHARFTLKQTQGTGRAFPWAIYQVQ
jgi:hypothetical protein